MTDQPEWARPGCYGQALTYSEAHPECRSCPFATSCKVDHTAALTRLRDAYGITLRKKGERLARAVETPQVAAKSGVAMALPKKVEELLARIERAGIRVSEALTKGLNPFPPEARGFYFLRMLSQVVLTCPAGVTREQMITGFEKKLNWSKGTAAAHATQAFQVLKALGVAEEHNGRLFLKR